ncbi:hypothetical protein F2P81_013310 [Scophthalmus maximus]|uniref:Uncharacterized protein n=1 Tax=Scophthalmus maximus TaxID=52904 RepID=A0A6A4SZZ0_SCOMX|nr:hypothetical protein F2P81_013310 [Scophthalmus maximus]
MDPERPSDGTEQLTSLIYCLDQGSLVAQALVSLCCCMDIFLKEEVKDMSTLSPGNSLSSRVALNYVTWLNNEPSAWTTSL